MKILLTGPTGFIGKNIYENLSKKYQIYQLSHKDTDLTDYQALSSDLKNLEPNAIIHCANKPSHRKAEDKKDITLINLKMFSAISKYASDCNVDKFISIGSGSEFDMKRSLNSVCEEAFGEYIPGDETGFPKYIINKILQNEKNAVNLRCFGIFGKYEDYNLRFISYAITRAIFNKDIIINENKRFSYLYINDLVKIIELFLTNKNKYSDYNIVPDYIYTMSEIAKLIIEIADSKSKICILNNGFDYTASNGRFKAEFDFKFTPFLVAIKELYNYYLSVKNELNIEG